MTFIISSIDPEEIKRQSEKYRVAASKVYYEIRKDFTTNLWKKFDSPEEVLGTIDYLLDGCLEQMQKKLNSTPLESRSADWAGLVTTGIHVYLRWTRFNQEDRDGYSEKYKGLILKDYVSLYFTFELVDDYKLIETNEIR